MGELEGREALVTGAGRLRGIGRATPVALAAMGADVVVTGTGRGETWQQAVESIPTGRPGSDEEVAGLIAFLCSASTTYITGQSININGGLAIW